MSDEPAAAPSKVKKGRAPPREKTLADVVKALEEVAEELRSARADLKRVEGDMTVVRARVDNITSKVMAFERHGAVLFLSQATDLAVPAPPPTPPAFRECESCGRSVYPNVAHRCAEAPP